MTAAALSIANPFQTFTGANGHPLNDGRIYVGTVGSNPRTNPVQVYFDPDMTIPAAQPIRTINGHPARDGSPATIYIAAGDCSVLVTDRAGSLVFSALSIAQRVSATQVMYTPPGTGAVTRSVQEDLDSMAISINQWGTDTASIQAAIDYWKGYAGPIKLTANGSFTVDAQIDCIWSSTDRHSKHIDFSGAQFNFALTSSGKGFNIKVDSAAGGIYVTNKTIENIRASCSNTNCTDMVLIDGGNNSGGALGYFYASRIKNIELYPSTSGNGLVIMNNLFETSVQDIDVRNYQNTTGYMVLIDQSTGSTGVVSSLRVDGVYTDGGYIGVRVVDFSDVWLQNISAIRAQREGIYGSSYQGNGLINAHVEANWASAGSYVVGNAGVRLDCSNAGGTAIGVYGPYSGGGYQTHALRMYGTSGTTLSVIGGSTQGTPPSGGTHSYFTGVSGATAVVIGTAGYSTDGNVSVVHLGNQRVLSPIKSSTIYRQNGSFAPITPSAGYPGYYVILGGNITINAPAFTPAYGDELEFTFEQGGSGGYSITWNAVYAVGVAPLGTYGAISTIRLKYLNTSAGGKWVTVSLRNFS